MLYQDLRKEGRGMFVSISFDGDPKEIAALALELREQQKRMLRPSAAEVAKELSQKLQNRIESDQI